MSESDFDATKIDLSRITFAAQDGVAQFELLARESLPAILGYDFDETMITDECSRSDFCGLCETREEFDAWERKVLQRTQDRCGARPPDSAIHIVDLFRDIEPQRRARPRQSSRGQRRVGQSGSPCEQLAPLKRRSGVVVQGRG